MTRVIACAACQQQLSLPADVPAGKQVRCPSCQAIMVVPAQVGAGKRPVILPAWPGSGGSTQAAKPLRTDALSKPLVPLQPRVSARPSSGAARPSTAPEPADRDEPIERTKKKKKKVKKSTALFTLGSIEITRSMFFILCGSLLFAGMVLTLIVVYVPFGKMLAGTPEAQIVDVYTAINAMGYNNIGVRVMNSDTTAYCIPGPRKIMITRPNPNGQYLFLRLQVPYADVDAHYKGAQGRNYLYKGHIQVEANGETKDVTYVQDDNATDGHFQMDYQPPKQEGLKVSLRDYIGPKANTGWTHQGDTKEYQEGLTFADSNGMQVKISVGAERQDGGGGNVLESMTGKKILGNQQALTGEVAGYVHVDWNVGSSGHIVHDDLEQPNEIGRFWKVHCIVELPKNAGNEVTLKVLGKSRKLKIR